jgi:hypothetical protein
MARKILPTDNPMREVRPAVERYKEVFGICKVKNCNEDRARGEEYCDDHVLVDAF